jgi:hypothetical protein
VRCGLVSVAAAAVVKCVCVIVVLRHAGLSGTWGLVVVVAVSVRVCGPRRLDEVMGGDGMVRHCVCPSFCGLTVGRGRFSWVEDCGGVLTVEDGEFRGGG